MWCRTTWVFTIINESKKMFFNKKSIKVKQNSTLKYLSKIRNQINKLRKQSHLLVVTSCCNNSTNMCSYDDFQVLQYILILLSEIGFFEVGNFPKTWQFCIFWSLPGLLWNNKQPLAPQLIPWNVIKKLEKTDFIGKDLWLLWVKWLENKTAQ